MMHDWKHNEFMTTKEDARKNLDPLGRLARQMYVTWVIGCLFGFACMVGIYVLLTVCPECRH
jgi:hypothetical protein